jgi:exodeoxyribonuclease VII small subunit
MAKKKTTNTLSYQEALSQLEEIVKSMEEGQPNIDALGEKVKKALALLEMCKAKLRNTEDTLNQAFEKE